MKNICLVFLMSFSSLSNAATNYIYQTGVTGATLTGAYTGSTSYETLLKEGNLGLGTANGITGEMVLIDGKMFITNDSNGHTKIPSVDTKTPFAIVSQFNPDNVLDIKDIHSKADFTKLMKNYITSDNSFYVIRLDGTFNNVKARSISKNADSSNKDLKDYIKINQVVNVHTNIDGTLVMFKSPEFAYPMTVPGYHIHFISKDERLAGHVYDFDIKNSKVSIQKIDDYRLNLPLNTEFINHNIVKVKKKTIVQVESNDR